MYAWQSVAICICSRLGVKSMDTKNETQVWSVWDLCCVPSCSSPSLGEKRDNHWLCDLGCIYMTYNTSL